MSDGSDPNTPRRREGLLESIFGKGGRAQYDDQVDIDTELTNKETFFLVGRAVGLLKPVKELFFAKFLLSTGMWVPGLLLPWIGKIMSIMLWVEKRSMTLNCVIHPSWIRSWHPFRGWVPCKS